MTNPIVQRTVLAFELLHELDRGRTADVETVKAQIAAGTLFEWLSEEFPDGLWDWGRYTDEEKSELLDNFDALAQDLDETRKLVVEHNGLALLLAYCLSRIQRLAGS